MWWIKVSSSGIVELFDPNGKLLFEGEPEELTREQKDQFLIVVERLKKRLE